MSKTGNNKLTFLVIFKLTFLVKIILTILEDASQIISGHKDEKIEILEPADLIRIYANSRKVFAVTRYCRQ